MSATVLLFLCILGFSIAQTCTAGQWDSTFNQSSVFSTGYGAVGVNQGTFSFNWNTYQMSIIYSGDQVWAEYYQYNSNRGATNYSGQTLSSYGKTCNPVCGVAALSSAMPPLGVLSGNTKGALVSGSGASACYQYSVAATTAVANFTMRDNGQICSVTLKDNRVFVMTGWTCRTGSLPTITVPANCSCKGKADIWILVDHSSSIDDTEMANFKNVFVQPFLNKLAISPDEINVGMSWFHLGTGMNFPLTGNIQNINAGMNNWFTNCSKYCRNGGNQPCPAPVGCQVGATATATGLIGYNGACKDYTTPTNQIPTGTSTNRVVGATEWFVAQANRNVPRIFITLTDGAMNRLTNPYYRGYWNSNYNSCTSSNNNNYDACTCSRGCQGDECSPELTTAVNDLITKTNNDNPGQPLTLISVGIGSTCTNYNQCLSLAHLKTLAGGKDNNILRIENFNADQLSKAVSDLVLLSCPAENNQANAQCIQGCCGLCVCGVCKPPTVTSCTNNNLCTKTTFNGVCCNADTDIPLPAPCAAVPANACNITTCNANIGQGTCQWQPLTCAPTGTCEVKQCLAGSCSVGNRSACPPQNCTYGEWDNWGACPVACGGSTRTRIRTVNRTAIDGGSCNPADGTQTEDCNTQCCPVDCVWGQWSAYGGCTKTCGAGTKTATRTAGTAICGGAACNGATSDVKPCNTQCCPVDCAWSAWPAWGNDCSKSCGTGTQSRTRTQIIDDCPGNACGGSDTQSQNCNTQNCPIDCLGVWSEWGTDCPCNPTNPASTSSLKYRYFTITRQAQFGGVPCNASDGSNESQVCQTDPLNCVTVNCSGHNVTTECTCENPTRTRTFVIDVRASGPNATECGETAGLKETHNCSCGEGTTDFCATYCPVNCEGYYTAWSNCSCTTFSQNRTYIVTKPANHSGIPCPAANETVSNQTCVPICPVPCVGAFAPGNCSCETKNKTTRYGITIPARDGGAGCPHPDGFTQIIACSALEIGQCPTPCVGEWSQWSACDCDYLNQTRTYTVTTPATNGGPDCDRSGAPAQICVPNATEKASCSPNPFCTVAADCDDSNKCTEDRCILTPRGVYRCDWNLTVVCNDNSGCTADTCDPIQGCIYTETVFCNDNSVCTNESCHPTKGCQYTNKICPHKDICFLGTCHPVQGCGIAARTCNSTSNCSIASCDVNYTKNGRPEPCYETYICPFDFGLIAGISAGAAVAIAICAALVALAVLGGGSYALASQMHQDDDTIITKNPMFQAKGTSGTNPLNVE